MYIYFGGALFYRFMNIFIIFIVNDENKSFV